LLNCEKRDSTGKVNDSVPVGCAVCYESVYPEHFAEYVRKGAELMTVITNDAWWGNTPGYRQHLSYSSLRAIETRRDIARSANTGISALINQKGDIVAETEWWKQAVLTGKVCLNDRQTFFVRQGDIVGRLCVFFSVLLLLGVAVRVKVRK
uniref:apolipoprotein N-acyltransferase n=1 Tax=Candidatus Cryptobacteroides bacterium TaxID=3085639 RepID=UPI00402A2D6A